MSGIGEAITYPAQLIGLDALDYDAPTIQAGQGVGLEAFKAEGKTPETIIREVIKMIPIDEFIEKGGSLADIEKQGGGQIMKYIKAAESRGVKVEDEVKRRAAFIESAEDVKGETKESKLTKKELEKQVLDRQQRKKDTKVLEEISELNGMMLSGARARLNVLKTIQKNTMDQISQLRKMGVTLRSQVEMNKSRNQMERFRGGVQLSEQFMTKRDFLKESLKAKELDLDFEAQEKFVKQQTEGWNKSTQNLLDSIHKLRKQEQKGATGRSKGPGPGSAEDIEIRDVFQGIQKYASELGIGVGRRGQFGVQDPRVGPV